MLRLAVRYIVRSVLLIAVPVTVLIAAVFGGYFAVERYILKAEGPHKTDVFVTIAPGDGHSTVRWTLARAGVINELYHYDAARIIKGRDFIPKEGEFKIPAKASLNETMRIIHFGQSHQRRLTVIEGIRSAQVIRQLDAVEFLIGDVSLDIPEGSVLPETYFYTQGTRRDDFIRRMQEKRQITLLEAWVNRQADLPFKAPEQALILASIIELETADSADRREVAGVFINRLRKGMRLQSDPTVLYGVDENPKRTILRSDLKRATDWNTYMISGLPKTPICNPSADAVDAALNPAETKNMYFVSDGKGGLRFARTLDAHNKNVRLYRKFQREAASGS
ncbi:MAG: endolytic transglycosylase MltG [Bacteroidetes bacterium]|nr:endolytic transglycosylase MltG [Bacteroidota bacterium]